MIIILAIHSFNSRFFHQNYKKTSLVNLQFTNKLIIVLELFWLPFLQIIVIQRKKLSSWNGCESTMRKNLQLFVYSYLTNKEGAKSSSKAIYDTWTGWRFLSQPWNRCISGLFSSSLRLCWSWKLCRIKYRLCWSRKLCCIKYRLCWSRKLCCIK